MHIPLTRGRLAALAVALLAIVALILGLIAPPTAEEAGARSAAPGLLVSEFSDTSSTLWLVAPDRAADPAARTEFLRVEHAPGWDIEGSVSPTGDLLAYLVLPPGRRDATAQAQLFVVADAAPELLADQLDLPAGLAWSHDGRHVFARRTEPLDNGGRSFTILRIDVRSGATETVTRRKDVLGLYPVGAGGGTTYVTVLGPRGSELVQINGAPSSARVISPLMTRDWTLSPSGGRLAFTEQQGVALAVRVIDLTEPPPEEPALRTAGVSASARGSASPVWRPNGDLSVGTFGEDGSPTLRVAAAGETSVELAPESGFALPVGWSADGALLALRSFSGSGPGDPGEERAAILRPNSPLVHLPGTDLRILGWWGGAN